MSKDRIRTIPNLADDSPIHQEAIANGDEHFKAWQYNVADHLKGKTVDEIKQSLKDTAFPFAIAMENLISDFNFSSLVRNANAFNAKEVFYIGDKKWDKRGACGVYNYTQVNFISSIDEFIELRNKYTFVGIDNITGSVPLNTYIWPKNPLMIIGSEGTGLTPTIQKLCTDLVYIKQYGSVRSLNAAVASGIIMNDFVTKFTES